MRFQVGQWVVCRNVAFQPSTWARIISSDDTGSWVRYGEGAPRWPGESWNNEYLEAAESEAAAKKIVEDYEASIPYDRR